MNNNDFTQAARAEAEDRYPTTHRDVPMYSLADVRAREAAAFVSGTEWQAEHGPTDADDLVAVSWADCDCEWETKYCNENHRRWSRVPRSVLARAARRDQENR